MKEQLISEEWLKEMGFKWHQLERQPEKMWLLWIVSDGISFEDVGVEVAKNRCDDEWFCWLRSDAAHRYSRFIHIRHLRTREELIRLVEGISGQMWDPALHLWGALRSPKAAAQLQKTLKRTDMEMMIGAPAHHKWAEIEKDDSRGGALPEHMEEHRKAGLPGL